MPTRTDPRLLRAVRSVNTDILHRAIRHAVLIERLKAQTVRDILRFLNDDVLPDLLGQIERRLGQGKRRWTTKRARAMAAVNRKTLQAGLRGTREKLTDALVQASFTEAEFTRAMAVRAAQPLQLDFTMPSLATLRAIVETDPMEGHLLRDWFSGLEGATGRDITRQINIGVAQGEGVETIVRRIKGTQAQGFRDGILQTARYRVRAIVRTAVAHTVNYARTATMEENQDVIKAEQFVAVLDHRTTEVCMGNDGKVSPVGEGPRPPLHFQCRSTIIPVLRSWEELGIPAREVPPRTRAAMNGQVPATMTYGDWLRQQPAGIQNEALGPARAELFRQGKVAIDRFADSRGNRLNLQQLRAREGLP